MAYVNHLLDNEEENRFAQISANTVEEFEFLRTVAKFLRTVKSVRVGISTLEDAISYHEKMKKQ